MESLKSQLIKELELRKSHGMGQNEIYGLLNFSRSHVSETLAALDRDGEIVRKRESKNRNRIWLTDYFPGYIKGLIRIGILRSSEYVPFLSSLHRTLQPTGVSIRVRPYNSAPDLISALHDNTLDIGLAPTFTHILFSMTNRRETLFSSLASGGSAVLLNRSIEDNILAASEASTMTLISRDLVRRHGARVLFFGDAAKARDDFLSGKFRYLAIWEPYMTELLKHDGVCVMKEDEEYQFLDPCCSVGASDKFLTAKRTLVKSIARDYEAFPASMKVSDLSYGLKIIAGVTGYTEKDIVESLKSYRFSGRLDREKLSMYMINVGIPISEDRLEELIVH